MPNNSKLTDKEWYSMFELIKILSNNIKEYYDSTPSSEICANKDISLISLQVLSHLVGLSRNYSQNEMDDMWEDSCSISKSIYKSKDADSATSSDQIPTVVKPTGLKN